MRQSIFKLFLISPILWLLSACDNQSNNTAGQKNSTSKKTVNEFLNLKNSEYIDSNYYIDNTPTTIAVDNINGQIKKHNSINLTKVIDSDNNQYYALLDFKTNNNNPIITFALVSELKNNSYLPLKFSIVKEQTQYINNSAKSYFTSGIDVHSYTAQFYHFLKNKLNMNSIDSKDATLTNFVDFNLPLETYNACEKTYQPSSIFNAFYNNKSIHFTPKISFDHSYSASADVIAHEWGHGITDLHSDLKYQNESGALNEAFSDWIAAAFDNYLGKEPNDYWHIGESVINIRSLKDPRFYNDPNHYKGAFWFPACKERSNCDSCSDYGGVHTNSGVGNTMFYRLVEGFTYNGHDYRGIGMEKAMEIALDANKNYWEQNTDFCQAKKGMMLSDDDFSAIVDLAWQSVGITDEVCANNNDTPSTLKFNIANVFKPNTQNLTYEMTVFNSPAVGTKTIKSYYSSQTNTLYTTIQTTIRGATIEKTKISTHNDQGDLSTLSINNQENAEILKYQPPPTTASVGDKKDDYLIITSNFSSSNYDKETYSWELIATLGNYAYLRQDIRGYSCFLVSCSFNTWTTIYYKIDPSGNILQYTERYKDAYVTYLFENQ